MRLLKAWAFGMNNYWLKLCKQTFSDKRLAYYLAELFESELPGLQVEGLRFYVKNRILSIYGTLYRDADHEQVIKLAGRIAGLEAVVDRIQLIEDVTREKVDARIFLMLTDSCEPMHLQPA